MGLLFCCPVCGSNLRVTRSAAVATIECPECTEPIRVPRNPHPSESAYDTPAIRAVDAFRARAGIARLKLSLILFAVCVLIVLSTLSLRTAIASQGLEELPPWVPFTLTGMVTVWFGLGALACWFRVRGYMKCRRAAESVGVDLWVKMAVAGAVFTCIGELSATPWLMGRPLKSLAPELSAFVMIGLLCGLIGFVLEFAFLVAIHRLLYDTAGWQAANRTGGYAVTFIFATMAAMATFTAGGMIVVLAAGGKPGQITPSETVFAPHAVEIRVVSTLVLMGLATIAGLVAWKYSRLLSLTRRALNSPQPYLRNEATPAG